MNSITKIIIGSVGVVASIVLSSICGNEIGKGLVEVLFKDSQDQPTDQS